MSSAKKSSSPKMVAADTRAISLMSNYTKSLIAKNNSPGYLEHIVPRKASGDTTKFGTSYDVKGGPMHKPNFISKTRKSGGKRKTKRRKQKKSRKAKKSKRRR